jgi:hypothetical protein
MFHEAEVTSSNPPSTFLCGHAKKKKLNSKQACVELDLMNLPLDPYLRRKIYDYHHNDRGQIQGTYLKKGHC